MLRNNYVGCLTAIYDSKIIGKHLMSEIRKRQDWVLWLRILKKLSKLKELMKNLLFTEKGQAKSSNKIKMIKYNWIVYNKELNFSKLKSFYLIINLFSFMSKKDLKIKFY